MSDPQAAEPEFQTIGRSEEIVDERARGYEVSGIRIAVIRHEGKLYALDEMCTHADASLAFGPIREGCVLCPWHYAEFCLETGEAMSGPACEGVKTYPAREVAEEIQVAVSLPSEQ